MTAKFVTAAVLGGGLLTASLAYSQGIPNYPCYRTVEETFATAEKMTKTHPDLAEWIDVGDSWQKANGKKGYDMMVLVLTNKKIKGDKPKFFATSAIHAREYATAELMTRFAEKMLAGYGKDPDITWMLDHQELHLMLMTNPDGRKKAEPNVMWRKNVNDNICNNGEKTGQGVDLNRNFPFKWNRGGGKDECGQTYRGVSAGSEPETQAVVAYQRKLFKDARGPNDKDKAPEDTPGTYLDIHSYGKIIYYPKGMGNTPDLLRLTERYGYYNTYKPTFSYHSSDPDEHGQGFLGRHAELSQEQIDAGVYESHRFNFTYTQAYGELGVASALYELGTKFFQGCRYFKNDIVPGNHDALTYAFRVVRAPYMLTKGPEAVDVKVSGKTLTAKLDDGRFHDSSKAKGDAVASAEYFVDVAPWQKGAEGRAMKPKDGKADSAVETFEAQVDVSGLSSGRHMVYVQGKDAKGNKGPVSAAWITVP